MQRKRLKTILAASAMMLGYLAAGCSRAAAAGEIDQAAISQAAMNRADQFLSQEGTGRMVLRLVHLGADYRGHSYVETRYVTDGAGNRLPGGFAMVYRFRWAADGLTDILFFCDPSGNVTDVDTGNSNGRRNPPFGLANLAIQVAGKALVEHYKEKMSRNQLSLALEFVDNANSRGLLRIVLQIAQPSE